MLQGQGAAATKTEVLCVRLDDRPGELARVMGVMADCGINVSYSYSLISTYIALSVKDLARAEELLAQWEAGDATEDSFAQLAQENSADTSSASNGGLLQYVSPYSGYVDTFTQWSLDPSRQPGDTGIIQNTGSSVKGYHIMYFAGWDDPVWAVSAKNALNNEQYSQWAEKLASACTVTRGSGLKYVE